MESCDFRLSTWETHKHPVKEEKEPEYVVEKPPLGPPGFDKVGLYDVGIVRFGYFNYLKLNTESMVMPFTADTWYRIDLVVDWEEQQIIIRAQNGTNTTDF